ncbi:MAG: hypothetical protein M3384_20185, partial [Acidobacteriota bacterium]|nr:hypothetical protein [Acidobacteriota bacterium]
MQHVEIGLDNQGLAWREHLFSDKMREIGDAFDLIWEPIFDQSDGKNVFSIVPETEVKWNWGDWEYAKKTFSSGKTIVSESRMKYPENSAVQLIGAAGAATLEVTLYNERGQGQTAAVKQHLSDKVYENNINFGMRGRDLLVIVGGGMSAENLLVEKYNLVKTQQLERVFASGFRGGNRIVIPDNPFGEYLAVVKQTGQKRKMLKCSAFNGNGSELIPISDEERKKLKVKIEGAPLPTQTASAKTRSWDEWLDNWCGISQERFLRLVKTACRKLNLAETEARRLAQHYPTGLNRALVLHLLGCPFIKTKYWSVEDLNKGEDFLTSVGAVKKDLARILEAMPTIEEKLWAIKEAENDCLE